ncbi:MAG: hypothetical protein IJ326_08185 [Lachnospiraceae bacterium]|nr:hypothetical protein [Lachnospiraceae bacterium]
MGKINYGVRPEECPFLTIERAEQNYIYRAAFPSLSQLYLFLSSNPTLNNFTFATQKSMTFSEAFAGEPLDIAIDYCLGGYEKDFSMFIKLKRDIDRVNLRHVPSRRPRPSVVGSRPNVPAFVAGAPLSMYRMDRVKPKKLITVYINLAYNNNTTEAQIRNRGILTLNLIKLLENNDYIVNFKVFEICAVHNEIFVVNIGLKKPGELLDVKKCYYPLCGKEFLRRVISRVKESMPFREKWHMTYGQLVNEQLARELMDIPEDAILISDPDSMQIYGENIYADADAFLEKLHLSEMISVPNYTQESKEHKN